MNGKNKCKILKEIRQKIAEDNDIELITSECKFQGNCSGTCPKCEEELRYLENELRKRQKMGKGIAIAGAGLALLLAANAGKTALDNWFEEQLRNTPTGMFPPGEYMSVDESADEDDSLIIYKI